MYDTQRYTYIDIGGIKLPLHIHICKIKTTDNYIMKSLDPSSAMLHESSYIEDKTDSFFYGKFKDEIIMWEVLNIVYDFVDFKNMDRIGYMTKILPRDRDEFIRFFMDIQCIGQSDITEAYGVIMFYLGVVREEFLKMVIEDLGVMEDYPNVDMINKDDDPSKTRAHQKYKKHTNLPVNMITQKCIQEYSGDVIFQENIGRAASDYSWREIEIRRLYTKKITDFDNFVEAVKSATMEELREDAKKRSERGGR